MKRVRINVKSATLLVVRGYFTRRMPLKTMSKSEKLFWWKYSKDHSEVWDRVAVVLDVDYCGEKEFTFESYLATCEYDFYESCRIFV